MLAELLDIISSTQHHCFRDSYLQYINIQGSILPHVGLKKPVRHPISAYVLQLGTFPNIALLHPLDIPLSLQLLWGLWIRLLHVAISFLEFISE